VAAGDMTLVNTGKPVLNNLVFKGLSETFTMHLFTAVAGGTVTEATALGDLTEADFPGYAAQAMLVGDWTVAGDAVASATMSFTHAGGAPSNTIIGFYLVATGGGELVWVGELSASADLEDPGDKLEVVANPTVDNI